MLNSMFFERVLGEVGRVLDRLDKEDDRDLELLANQEGKAFLCFQIYRQNVHNPKLLEISEKRIEKISELRKKWKALGGNSITTTKVDANDSPSIDLASIVVDNNTLTIEMIDLMKSDELKKECDSKGLILEKYNVEPMRKALKELVNEES